MRQPERLSGGPRSRAGLVAPRPCAGDPRERSATQRDRWRDGRWRSRGQHGQGFRARGDDRGHEVRRAGRRPEYRWEVLITEIGGAMGPLYGSMFLDMATAADGAATIDADRFGRMLEAGLARSATSARAEWRQDAARGAGASRKRVRSGDGRAATTFAVALGRWPMRPDAGRPSPASWSRASVEPAGSANVRGDSSMPARSPAP